MLSSLGLALAVCLMIGAVIVVAFVVKAGEGRSDCTIARVLYDTEHPRKVR